MRKKDRKWICGIPAAAVLCMAAGVFKFFKFAICREGTSMPGKKNGETEEKRIWRKYWDSHVDQKEWLSSRQMEDVSILSEDGLKLTGKLFSSENPKRIIVCAHGYRGNCIEDFAAIAGWLHENGCDLLLIDQRGTGNSEGKYITFGAKEKKDIVKWCEYLDQRNQKCLPVYLYGISMGCTSVLLASDQGLSSSVKGIIADCGYSSIREIFEARTRESFHLPPYPMMYFMKLYCYLISGFRFEEADAVKAMEKNTIPVLFLHGEEDHFVRPENTLRNFEACRAEKKLVMIPGAAHAVSVNENPALYTETIRQFFELCEEKENRA